MWKLALGLLFVLIWAPPQAYQELLLRQARHIVGVVVDSEGRPVAEARIDHSNDSGQVHETDSDGRFVLDTKAPALVVRKVGFHSELIRTENVAETRVVLRRLTQNRALPPCVKGRRYQGIIGWGSRLQFPRIPGVKASAQGRDIDYGIRFYTVKTSEGRKAIRQGSGPFWSFGIPSDMDVWRTIRLEETVSTVDGQTLTDSRGQLGNGHWWRYLGIVGESADYWDVDERAAQILDEVLDGACLSSGAARQ